MLRLKKIVKDYYVNKDLTVNALKGVSLDFRKNEFVSILGPSGCGKTTLLNIIGGLDKYTKGDLEIDGVSTKNFKENDWNAYRNQRIGFVFQSYNLIPHQTILENVALALTIAGLSAGERREKAKKALIEVGLEKEIHKRPNQLSGGQMQRVAIARALVNDPQIVLADEPTGALDSKTSVQILDLLKKVAENYLVIMVTHNSALAEQYSTRIITLLDGSVTSDTMPFDADTQKSQTTTEQKGKVKRKVKMNFFTALKLSLKNLLTKKGRTISTSFAGSIGIIGVALVLALSNGFNLYIARLQSDTLSGFPITVASYATDMNAIYEQRMTGSSNPNPLPRFPEGDNNVHVYSETSILTAGIHYNNIDQNYIDFLADFENEQNAKPENSRIINGISYSYANDLSVFTDNNGDFEIINTSNGSSSVMSMFSGGGSSVFQEALSNAEFVNQQYDVLYGKYPTDPNEVAVIVDSRNRISVKTLSALGFSPEKTGDEYDSISFDDMLDKKFFLISHGDYYIKNGAVFNTLENYYSDPNALQTALSSLSTSNNTTELSVVGVLRVNQDSALDLYDTGILYLPSLTQKYITDRNQNSDFYKAQVDAKTNGNVFVGMNGMFISQPVAVAQTALNNSNSYGLTFTVEQTYATLWQMSGASSLPSAIYIYPKDFDAKDQITAKLDSYNDDKEIENSIFYTDAAAILSSSMGQMIDIISYVLIAFASISLVVSSVMIGIITYVSVIERTKEIGVLRSLGASKNDVSSVFNAETIIIGFVAGLLGVLITYLLCIPINAILISVAGGSISTNLAILNPLAALILIGISCLLTLIGGAIPSRFAAKLDPVKALRSE